MNLIWSQHRISIFRTCIVDLFQPLVFSGVAWIAFQNIEPQSLSAILAHKMEMVVLAFHLTEEFRCNFCTLYVDSRS
jgi:hypothetical protein